MPTPAPTTKPEWRAWAIAARANLDRDALAALLRARLVALPLYQAATKVALFAATSEELDFLPLTEDRAKAFFLPRCAPQRRLTFHRYPCPLVRSAYGIREPESTEPEIDPLQLDLVIVPALAATPTGLRLGYGGGYYDRFLAQLAPHCATLLALPDACVVAQLPHDPWDIPIKFLLTESKFLQARGGHDINFRVVPL